ncbi:prepilin-type N-terminal cleavage/methylation domain-containing protein [Pseudomonadota bacterium]
MKHKQAGFTLIEISIVLVVIGLLLGGVLKGQEMIENARISNLRNDFEGVTAAIYAYQDRYRALPGDDNKANNADRGWTDSAAGNGNGALNTNNAFDAGAGESGQVWQHLRYAGLITGDPSGTTNNVGGRANPVNAFGGKVGFTNSTAAWGLGLNGHLMCASNVPGKAAAAIDSSLDDGNADTGQMRGITATGNTPATFEPAGNTPATAYLENGPVYTVCQRF